MARIVILAACLCAAPAWAGDKGYWWDVFCPGRLKLPLCCPDDYCPKPKPPLPAVYCPCGCDDYSGKPPPELGGTAGKCYPTDGCGPKPKCWWLKCPWWGKRLCGGHAGCAGSP
jgi:hypothetical protein